MRPWVLAGVAGVATKLSAIRRFDALSYCPQRIMCCDISIIGQNVGVADWRDHAN